MTILNFEDFFEQKNLKNDTLIESEFQTVYNFYIYPRDTPEKKDVKSKLCGSYCLYFFLLGLKGRIIMIFF